ncbi:hypothetical protein [Streptomyces rapamycinicus]|uniref:Uncharacterized protein n=2 Tax=Streptomyces rapamycinicus TaxID=1226757 RepID=A0A0A0NCS6_STRRN|nr:hypothetical protein [Streptomyces rapamycinicus]AGP55046.1 hypothetical protein M271_17420 [Streptomyces rapamycinicus NRRL 5491]MBB4782577.1 hypothetical protein [Streptomyces rapamycinicus]RLV81940.1 hypothetical protein D3C57_126185 [Streptomyces rapamycinicus NRRL 5491]UTO63074.1 hypothetical protein LJB45_12580 [Streptomyces rapamycinicus]UTP31033.1 hypothetical protein LIV37_17695 [Streptomyces rapamycinicus NRRL 5491]
MISHITVDRRDATYDHHAEQAVLPVTVHHRDGRTEPTRLVMDPGQVELYFLQLGRLIDTRAEERRRCGELAGM